MTTPAFEEDRHRRGFLLALLGGVFLLLLGVFGGWFAFGSDRGVSPQALSVSASPEATSDVTVVLPAQQAAGRPSSSPVTQGGGGAVTTESNSSSAGGGSSNAGHPLVVSGTVVGTVGPGSPARLGVTIDNPNNQGVILTSVSGTISAVSSAGISGKPVCSVSWYHVGSFVGPRTIPKNSSTSVDLPVTFDDLPSVNQDNCKGAQYTYTFTAQARQA
jgi:hypothetical protein